MRPLESSVIALSITSAYSSLKSMTTTPCLSSAAATSQAEVSEGLNRCSFAGPELRLADESEAKPQMATPDWYHMATTATSRHSAS
eukprot:CAMPEP_0178426910 /NCGR_PEP_ID=MMETSP0689_2-20121128/29474_1 /TAXON_ID=160604 /ORGANISM="Amphidinium massartii, Strain CS-259" /LENGTH=85 /DNA_ID=CAMNT_0020048603 /DNA_START=586 /DNA_END=840 /DNA_ORIENTATION=+